MGQTASELKTEVAEKRAEVGKDLDALGDKISPGRALDRRKAAAGRRLHGMREAVMGSASSVAENVSDAPHVATRTVRGNPLAVGLIAVGGGMLVASLLPKSDTEQELAQSASGGLQRAASELRGAGEHVVADLRDSAQEAAAHVKEAAGQSAAHITEEAGSAAEQIAHPPDGNTGR